jgi:hypothetical protein
MSHNLETSLEYVKLDAITNKPEENIQLKVEENPEEKEIEAEKVEEPVKPKRPRGRPKKQKE